MAWTIKRKLIFAFGVVVSFVLILAVVGKVSLGTLESEFKSIVDRSTDAIEAARSTALSGEIYGVFADTIINHKLDEAEKDWKATKDEAEKGVAQIEKIVDTDEERAVAKELRKGLVELVDLYEKELLPLVKGGKFAGPEIEALDAKADALVTGFHDGFHKIEKSLVAENENESLRILKTISLVSVANVLVSLVALLVAALAGWLLSGAIVHPIQVITTMADRLALGITAWSCSKEELEALKRRPDELGALTTSLDALVRHTKDHEGVAEAISNGDLVVRVAIASKDDTLGRALERMATRLRDTFSEFRSIATQVATGAGQVASASQALSQGATSQAASVEEITSSVTEIGSRTRATAENARKAAQVATNSCTAAESGKVKIATALEAMNEINGSSQQIAKIIKTIDDIAFQTNLLALNAAVEAARAGKHGKGFAVVADEVRNLAGRSAKAAKETADLISSSNAKVSNGLSVVNESVVVFNEIYASATEAAQILSEISQATNKQAHGVTQISQALEQVERVTQQQTASSEESAAAAEEMSAQARELQNRIGQFKTGGDTAVRLEKIAPVEKLVVAPKAVQPAAVAKTVHKPVAKVETKSEKVETKVETKVEPKREEHPVARSKTADVWPKQGDSKVSETRGHHAPKQSAASEIIALDDDEFGKFSGG